MTEQYKTYLELRKKRDEAERNQADCAWRIKSYGRMLVDSNPMDQVAYGELLEKLHEEEQRAFDLANRVTLLNIEMLKVEQQMH